MINMELLSYSNILNAVQNEISPRAYKVLVDDIMAMPNILSNNALISHALLAMNDDSADHLFTRLQSMADYVQGTIDAMEDISPYDAYHKEPVNYNIDFEDRRAIFLNEY